MRNATAGAVVLSFLYAVPPALAQSTSASAAAQPGDAPSIAVGVVLFPDYTYTISPTTVDTDGNSVHVNQFNLTRGFLNVTGRLSKHIGFRFTPDVARETSQFSGLAGSLELRVQYAYAQVDFDEWMTPGSFARFGIQQTPWLDFQEGIYRYRFQGTMFAEREGYLLPGDAGASLHWEFPSDYGDVHVGVYNGEGSSKAEVNGQKAFMVRGTFRPFANASLLHGLRASIFYDADRYVENGPRNRLMAGVTFEHPYLNAGFEFLDAADRTSISRAEVDGRGFSVWATPKTSRGWEGLLRYDQLKPNTLPGSQVRKRTIAGVAYWFPHEGATAAALLFDYDGQTFENFLPAQKKQSRAGVHGLISF